MSGNLWLAELCHPAPEKPRMDTTSLSLIRRLKQPDRDDGAWRRFTNLYSPLLMLWAGKTGLSHAEAEDVAQEVLILLLDKLPKFEHDGRTFRGWLRTMTNHKAIDYLRARGRLPVPASSSVIQAGQKPEDEDLAEERDYQQFLTHRALELMKSEFEETTWRACWGTTVEDRSAKEVGKELGMSEGAVYVAKSRVLRRLREELEGFW